MDDRQEKLSEEKRAQYHEKIESEKSAKKKKTIVWLIVFLLVVCLLLAAWQFRQKILPENAYERLQLFLADMESGNGFPYTIKGNESINSKFECSNQHAAVLSDTAFTILNKKGNEIVDSQVSYTNPSFAISEIRYLLYGIGEKKYKIESVMGLIYEGETENNILAADISEKGAYIIAEESKSHASEFSVFDPDGIKEYNYKMSSSYITDVCINDSGTKGAVCAVSGNEGLLSSEIYVFDFNSSEPICEYKTDDTLYFDVQFGANGIICIGEDRAAFLDSNGEMQNEVLFNEGKLLKYDVYEDSAVIALSPYNDSGKTEIYKIDANGQKTADIKEKENISGLSFYGDVIAVLTKSSVKVFSTTDGSLIKQFETNGDAHKIELSDVNSIYIMGFSKIYFETF